jgi:hypothetical protein
MSDQRPTLSVRIDPKALRELKEFGGDFSVTQAEVIEKLLKYFFKQTPDLQAHIIAGIDIDQISIISSAMEQIEWGNHAYSKRFWPWAIETYSHLYIKAEGVEVIVRLSAFKLGSAWMDLAMDLRQVAFWREWGSGERREYYMASIQSLRFAVAYFIRFNRSLKQHQKSQPPHPVVLYNEACVFSLIAQYITEMDATEDRVVAAQQSVQQRNKAVECKRPSFEGENNISLKANQFTSKAMDRLNSMGKDYYGDLFAFSDMQWLFEHSNKDPDLEFIRDNYNEEFGRWLSKYKSTATILESYNILRSLVPKDIKNQFLTEVPDVQ